MKKILLFIVSLSLITPQVFAADTKLTALGSVTPTSDDLLYVVDNPSGTPASSKVTIFDFIASTDPLPMASSGSGSAATRYTQVFGTLSSATETDVNNYRTQRNCMMQNLKATIDTEPGGAGRSWDVTVRDDAAGTLLTCNIPNGSTECNNTTAKPTVAADSKTDVEWLRNGASASPGNMVANWECVPT